VKPKPMRSAVIGLGFGDEGKGMVTSYLCSYYNNPLVVRYSGGHQAGHNVHYEGISHVFASFGCGTLHGVPTYWSKHCTFDPIGFMNELDELRTKYADPIKVYIHKECPVTTPFERAYNQHRDKDMMHGTCGVGFGQTLEREENHVHLQVGDLFNPTVFIIKLEMIKKYYNFMDDVVSAEAVENKFKSFKTAVAELHELLNRTIEVVDSTGIPAHPNTIYEGSQGLLLDQDIGFFPHVTRSNVGRKRLDQFIYHYDEVWYVTRAYQTRHGEGPMSNLEIDLVLQNATQETNLKNEWQGEFRRTVLDVDLLKYALEQDRNNVRRVQTEYLVITCLDQMTEWMFTENRVKFTFDNESEFIENLIQALDFKGMVYLSRSSDNNLTEWKGGRK